MDKIIEWVLVGLVFPLVTGFVLTRFQSRDKNNGKETASSDDATQAKLDEYQRTIAELKRQQEQLQQTLNASMANRAEVNQMPGDIQLQIRQQERAINELKTSAQTMPPMWQRIVKNLLLLGYVGWFIFFVIFVGYGLLINLTENYTSGLYNIFFIVWFGYGILYGAGSLRQLWGRVNPPNIVIAVVAYIIGLVITAGVSLSYSSSELQNDLLIVGGFALIHFFLPPLGRLIYNLGRKTKVV